MTPEAMRARLPLRLDEAARARCMQILTGEWEDALNAHPGWEDKLLAAIEPRNFRHDG